ncbi:MAG: crosslink repair DNA glycosylase YcaQ family protein [Anaerolineales bacterium]
MNKEAIKISKQQARLFLTQYHFLYPARSLTKEQILPNLFQRLKCIQFDTINVVGRNADLVLQSRVKNYTPDILDQHLYQDRVLIDGWDKVASIYPTEDWPYFDRHRNYIKESHRNNRSDVTKIKPKVTQLIGENGEMSSIHFKDKSKTDWAWGPTSVSRAALDSLYAEGVLGIHHRVNTRRHFDLIERLVPEKILKQPDPNQTLDEYLEWHILRRISSVGIASPKSGEHWLGIHKGRLSKVRNKVINRLLEKDEIVLLEIDGLEGKVFFLRADSLSFLENISTPNQDPSAAFIAPLDNLIWNRALVNDIFDFSYVWEVYKPKDKREYGYYVLPVLYGENFIARVDMKFDSKLNRLNLNNWWWEPGIKQTEEIHTALHDAFKGFIDYLSADSFEVNIDAISNEFIRNILFQLV